MLTGMIAAADNEVSLDAWITRGAKPIAQGTASACGAVFDQVIAQLDPSVELLGFGEALHGGETILQLRNLLFAHLVQHHGYRSIAMETGSTRVRLVNGFVTGTVAGSYADVADAGFGNGFGALAANRELMEWMRSYNAGAQAKDHIRFYGFDLPNIAAGIAGPRQTLAIATEYWAAHQGNGDRAAQRQRELDDLIGADADWENPAAMMDASQAIGRSARASALRIAVEDLIAELRTRRPELLAGSDAAQFAEALHYATTVRELLNFHAAMARPGGAAYAEVLGIRDAAMADNLQFIVERERRYGKVLAFAHNSHLQRSAAVLPWARWWSAGAHLDATMAARYAVIGTGVGASEANGIAAAAPATLEGRLQSPPGFANFIATQRGETLNKANVEALAVRSSSSRNPTYIPLTAQSLQDFDWLAVVPSTTYSRGSRPLPE